MKILTLGLVLILVDQETLAYGSYYDRGWTPYNPRGMRALEGLPIPIPGMGPKIPYVEGPGLGPSQTDGEPNYAAQPVATSGNTKVQGRLSASDLDNSALDTSGTEAEALDEAQLQENTKAEDKELSSDLEDSESETSLPGGEFLAAVQPFETAVNSEVQDKFSPSNSNPFPDAISSAISDSLSSGMTEFQPQFPKFPSQPTRPITYQPNYPFTYYSPPQPAVSQVTYSARYMPQAPFTTRNPYETEYERLTEKKGTYPETSLAELTSSILKHGASIKKAIVNVLQYLAEDITGESAYKLCGYGKVQLTISQAVTKFGNGFSNFMEVDTGLNYRGQKRNAFKAFRTLQDSLREAGSSIENDYKTENDEVLKHIKEIDDLIQEGIRQLTPSSD